MELKRKPFQGICNVIWFNRNFYFGACLVIVSMLFLNQFLPDLMQSVAFWVGLAALLAIMVSLLITWYIYDCSELYQLKWLVDLNKSRVLNIHAGFDETSDIIKSKYPECDLTICDFYDPGKHTEISIKRARMAYPPADCTVQVSTNQLPFPEDSFDYSLTILSAHEIRASKERIGFFKELNRVTKPYGKIFVTEHLRDWKNFVAYTIGIFHFHSKARWLETFGQANLKVMEEIKTTPFITTFILEKNGNTH